MNVHLTRLANLSLTNMICVFGYAILFVVGFKCNIYQFCVIFVFTWTWSCSCICKVNRINARVHKLTFLFLSICQCWSSMTMLSSNVLSGHDICNNNRRNWSTVYRLFDLHLLRCSSVFHDGGQLSLVTFSPIIIGTQQLSWLRINNVPLGLLLSSKRIRFTLVRFVVLETIAHTKIDDESFSITFVVSMRGRERSFLAFDFGKQFVVCWSNRSIGTSNHNPPLLSGLSHFFMTVVWPVPPPKSKTLGPWSVDSLSTRFTLVGHKHEQINSAFFTFHRYTSPLRSLDNFCSHFYY